jgi:hypothetical protein
MGSGADIDEGAGRRFQPIRAAERVVTTILESARSPIRADTFHGLTERGSSSPLGAAPASGGTNFSIFSKHAIGVELLLFDRVDDRADAARMIRIDPPANRPYHYWPVLFAGVRAGRGRCSLSGLSAGPPSSSPLLRGASRTVIIDR